MSTRQKTFILLLTLVIISACGNDNNSTYDFETIDEKNTHVQDEEQSDIYISDIDTSEIPDKDMALEVCSTEGEKRFVKCEKNKLQKQKCTDGYWRDEEECTFPQNGTVINCINFDSFEQYSNDSWNTVSLSYKGLKWSCLSQKTMNHQDAINYCEELDARLPTISELRKLIHDCSYTETGGKCGVTDDCLSEWECRHTICDGCSGEYNYSVFRDYEYLFSSSVVADNPDEAWGIYFTDGYIGGFDRKDVNFPPMRARCVQ